LTFRSRLKFRQKRSFWRTETCRTWNELDKIPCNQFGFQYGKLSEYGLVFFLRRRARSVFHGGIWKP